MVSYYTNLSYPLFNPLKILRAFHIGGGEVKRRITSHLANLVAAHKELLLDEGGEGILGELVSESDRMPRWVRINELKTSVEEGLIVLSDISQECSVDVHIPSLVGLENTVKGLGEHRWVKEGKLIIQDKASCFPSQILMDKWRYGNIIDACAAPGNKTTHMAMCLQKAMASSPESKGHIFAFDKSIARCDLLRRRIEEAGATNLITAANEDFLAISVDSFRAVTSVLCDPSCSGSGVARAVERVVEEKRADEPHRLENLHAFQVKVVLKAMSFPAANVVVYSTCSIHVEENESVVAEVLNTIGSDWDVEKPERFKDWTRVGVQHAGLTDEQSKCLIR